MLMCSHYPCSHHGSTVRSYYNGLSLATPLHFGSYFTPNKCQRTSDKGPIENSQSDLVLINRFFLLRSAWLLCRYQYHARIQFGQFTHLWKISEISNACSLDLRCVNWITYFFWKLCFGHFHYRLPAEHGTGRTN